LRRSVYEKAGDFNTQYRIAADYDHILRVFSMPNFKSLYIPRVLVKMRVGGLSNRSLRNIISKSKEDYLVLRRNQIGGVGALLWKNLSKFSQFI
jgi:glycosyltransferase